MHLQVWRQGIKGYKSNNLTSDACKNNCLLSESLTKQSKAGFKNRATDYWHLFTTLNAQEHLNDLETEEKSTGNVNIFADAKTHHLQLHNSFKALSPWNPQSSSLKSQPRQQILYQTLSIYMVILYHPATAWIQMCFTKCVCQEFSAGAVTACSLSCSSTLPLAFPAHGAACGLG